MEIILNKVNDIALFAHLNQWDEKITRMMCTFYAPAINLKYNCWITLTEEDIKKIAERQNKRGKFSYTEWGYGYDGVDALLEYIRENHEERGWNIPNLAKMSSDQEASEWLKRGFSVIIGIKVNKHFYQDKLDGKIDRFEDYSNYEGDIGHFTNLMTWNNTRAKWSESYWKECIMDSYFTPKDGMLYEADHTEIFKSIDMRTKFVFF